MDILYIVNARMPTEKAHGWQVVKSIQAWQKLGVKINLIVPRRRNYIKNSIKEYYRLSEKMEARYLGGYFNWTEVHFKSLYFHLQRMEFSVLSFFYSLFIPADAIYSRSITLCFFLSIFGKLAVYEDHEPKNRLIWLYRFFVKAIKKKVLVAFNLKELYQKFNVDPQSYIVASNGVDLEEFATVKPDKAIWEREFGIKGEKIILYIGHFYPWKGVYTLLNASKEIQGAVVLVGGTKEDVAAMQEYVRCHNLKDVYVRGFVPHQEIIQYIKSADALILPNTAKEERSSKYTTPIKMFEYMASGVPIVASNLHSFTHYLIHNKNARLCRPDDPTNLAYMVNNILLHPEKSRKLADDAYAVVREYTWERRAEKIIRFINQ